MYKMAILFILAAVIFHANAATSVERIGNSITEISLSGVDIPKATFLQKDIILQEGVVFAFSAFYRSDKPVIFQIWRPVDGSSTYKLISETRVLPAVIGAREDTYIESRLSTEKCIRVQENDQLGVHFEQSPGAVSYIFDASSPTALNHRLPQNSTYSVGDEYIFDALVFPYDFAVAAYIDVDRSHYAGSDPASDFVDCYKGLLIPDYLDLGQVTTTAIPPPTGAPGSQGPPGATGATGAVGPAGRDGKDGSQGTDGATGLPGPSGNVGATGATGNPGVVGATGPAGPKGDKGDPGKIYYVVNGSDPILTDIPQSKSASVFTTESMSMGYLIWLIILSVSVVVLLIIIIVIIVHKKRDRESPEKFGRSRFPSTPSSHGRYPSIHCGGPGDISDGELNLKTPPVGGIENWMDTMKDETETTYSNDTLQRNQDFTNGSSMPNLAFENETKVSELGY